MTLDQHLHLLAEGDNHIGFIGDPAVGKHMDQMSRNADRDMKRLAVINPAHMPGISTTKEGAGSYRSSRGMRSVRSTLKALSVELAAKAAGCPKCGGRKIVLMPTDFETAKCKDCGKTWQVPAKLHAGGPGSGSVGHTTPKEYGEGTHVTVHFSPTIKTHGHVEGHLRKEGKLSAYLVRHSHGVMQALPAKVSNYQKPTRAPKGTGPFPVKTPGGRIQRFLESAGCVEASDCPKCGNCHHIKLDAKGMFACPDCKHSWPRKKIAAHLEPGSGKKTISDNIAIERKAGKPEDQSIAIAYRKAGKR